MRRTSSTRRQLGRSMELPIVIAAVGIALAVLVPMISRGEGWLESLLSAGLAVAGIFGGLVALALIGMLPGMVKDWVTTPAAVRAARKRRPLEALRGLSPARLDPRATDRDGNTALHAACDCYEDERKAVAAEVIALLLERGADVHAKNAGGETALLLAVRRGLGVDAVRRLLAAGASPEAYLHDAVGQEGADALDVAKALLDAGASAGDVDVLGTPALHRAARYADAGMVRELLGRGASVDAVDREGSTALHECLWMPSLAPERTAQVIAALVEAGADPERPDRSGTTPRALAEASGIPALVEAMNVGRRH